MPQQVKTKKIMTTVNVNGVPKEVEIEVPDIPASWGEKKDRKNVGADRPRVDGPAKVSGRAKYTFDMNLPGMLWGKILRSPHAKAKIVKIDLGPAEKLPGVAKVIRLKDDGSTVVYAGQEVAALAAVSPEVAEDAIRQIVVTYEVMPHVVQEKAAKAEGAPSVVGNRGNVDAGRARTVGNVEEAFGKAAAVVEGYAYAPSRVHASLETHGHVVAYQQDGTLKVWASTQAVHGTADQFAGMSGLPKSQIEVVTDYMGGGFGSKFGPGVEGSVAHELAKQTGKPVKLMLNRREEFETAGNAPSAGFNYKMAADADGKLTACYGRGAGTGGIGGAGVEFPYGIFKFPNIDVSQDTIRTNLGASNAFRAPGRPQASFLTECGVDALAYKLNMDPLEFRMKNEPDPVRLEEYRIGGEAFGWKTNFNKTPGKGSGPVLRGIGVAGSSWGGGGGSPQMKAEVRINTDGSVEVLCGTQDLGTGVRTMCAAIVADELGIPMGRIASKVGHSTYPVSGGSGGSTTTPTVAPSVKMAAIQAKFDFLRALAGATNQPLDKLKVEADGSVSNGEKKLSWDDACKRLPAGGVTSVGTWNAELVQGNVRGAQFAEVSVDTETGRVRVHRLLAVQDSGIIMNPLTWRSQVNGGMIQGLAWALSEVRLTDQQTGRLTNPNFETYKIPGAKDMPTFDVIQYEGHNPKGVAGSAEATNVATATAIANAVYNAIGVRVTELPLTPQRILTALLSPPAPLSPEPATQAKEGRSI